MREHLAWWGALALSLLLQSTLFPHLLPPEWAPDLTRPLVLWAAVIGAPRGGALLAFAAGLGLDAATGAPPGFGAGLRLFLYGLARPLRGLFFDDRPVLLFPLAVLGTAADALGAWALSRLALPVPLPAGSISAAFWRQAAGDLIAVPMVFLLLEAVTDRKPLRRLSR